MTTRDEYVSRLKSQLERWNGDITRWEAQAASAKEDLKKRYTRQLEVLRARREKALYTLHMMEEASAAAWGDLRWGVDDAWDRMHEAIKDARSHFERGHRESP